MILITEMCTKWMEKVFDIRVYHTPHTCKFMFELDSWQEKKIEKKTDSINV